MSQKPPVDTSTFKWQLNGHSNPRLSRDGSYVYYDDYSLENKSRCIIRKTFNEWRLEVPNVSNGKVDITADNQYAVFIKSNDTLGIYQFFDSSFTYIPNVISFKVFETKTPTIIYSIKGPSKDVIIYDLVKKHRSTFVDVEEYQTVGANSLLITKAINQEKNLFSTTWVDVDSSAHKVICVGSRPINLSIDHSHSQVGFVVDKNTAGYKSKEVWYYRRGWDRPELLDSFNSEVEPNLEFSNLLRFSKDGRFLFFNFREKASWHNSDGVNVWSYYDAKLQSVQQSELANKKVYRASINLSSKKVVRIEFEDEQVLSDESQNGFILTQKCSGDKFEWNWNQASKSSGYLISLFDGSRKLINISMAENTKPLYTFSSAGQYVIYYKSEKRNYFAYDIAKGISSNITIGAPSKWSRYDMRDWPAGDFYPIGIAGFAENDSAVFIYDHNDIVRISLKGQKSILNITNRYGEKNGVRFRFALEHLADPIKSDEEIILSAFNRSNKYDGFYKIKLGVKQDPQLLTMQPCMFTGTDESSEFYPAPPKKAKDANIFLVRRMTASEYPSFYYTKDFVSFAPVATKPFNPQKNFNWLSTELVNWKTLEGKTCQGILYKPEDFNPTKKYPIIFYYYERLSEGLYGFLTPHNNNGTLNIVCLQNRRIF